MKRIGFLRKKILAAFLILPLLLGAIPVNAQENQVTLTELEEVAAPTEFPAKGTICMQIAKNVGLDAGGYYVVDYSEDYLPVVVDEAQRVYAKLSTLADHLMMSVEYGVNLAMVRYYDTTVYLEINSSEAGYQNSLFCAYLNMGQVPVIYEEEWYVPLDAFLQVTDCFAMYDEGNEFGKQNLLIVPPQRTILDDLSDFKQNLYKDYVFEYTKDIGYTEENTKKIAGKSAVIRYLYGLLAMEWDSFSAISGLFTEYGIEQTNFEYMDNYMTYLLTSNEEELTAILDSRDDNVDALNLYDVLWSDEVGLGGFLNCQVINNSAMNNEVVSTYMKLFKSIQTGGSIVASELKAGSSFFAIYQSLEGVDKWSKDGAVLFVMYRDQISNKVMSDALYERAQKNIKEFSGDTSVEAYQKWIKENWIGIAMDAASIAGNETLGLFGVLSNAGVLATNALAGRALDIAENFMTGSIGIQYQIEAVAVAGQCLNLYINGNTYKNSVSTLSSEELRKILYHAMDSCYTARYFGCLVAKDGKAASSVISSQKAINKKLAQMMGRLKNPGVPMGRVPKDFVDVNIQQLEHFENIVFNLSQIQGEVLSWENEEPLKNVKIEVVGDDGTTLTEFVTDEEGMFNEAFELNDVDPYAAAPLTRVLTLHLTHKKNPEVLERIEVASFKSYLIEGLHAGRKTDQFKAYLYGAKDENGRTVLDILRVNLAEDTVYFDIPDWQEGTYETYTVLPGQMELGSELESVMLDEKMTFETIYTQMIPEGSFIGGMARLMSQLENDMLPEALLKTKLHDAGDIQAFVDAYVEINGEYPSFEINTVNSLVESMEPIMILTAE